jgi:hypothetical protein
MTRIKQYCKRCSLVLVLVAGLLTGCTDAMNAYQRAVWGADCRPETLNANNGRCGAAK